MRVIAVVNQKGGAGKSTTVMNLAAMLQESGMNTLVADVDPQQTASGDWADSAGDALPFDITQSTNPADLAQLRQLDYDVIVVDTPGSLEAGSVLATVLEQADFAILPCEPGPLSVKPLMRTIDRLVKPAGVQYRVLVSRVDPRVVSDALNTFEMLDTYEVPHFATYVRTYKTHTFSPLDGVVATQYVGRSSMRAVEDFRKLHAELLTIWAK